VRHLVSFLEVSSLSALGSIASAETATAGISGSQDIAVTSQRRNSNATAPFAGSIPGCSFFAAKALASISICGAEDCLSDEGTQEDQRPSSATAGFKTERNLVSTSLENIL
jgi:hypothetical protein